MKRLIFTLLLSVFILSSFAQSMDDKIKTLANDIADHIVKNGKKTVAISIPLYKKEITEFGEYFAEELSGKIAISDRNVTVVNQKKLAELLKQNKLTAAGLLIAKNEAAKLGQASGIDALAYGSIISFGEELQISLNIVELKTTNIIGNSKLTIPLTTALKELLVETGSGIVEVQIDSSPKCKTENTCTVCITNQSNQDITTMLYDWPNSNKDLLINPNSTECWKNVKIRPEKDFETMVWVVNLGGQNVNSEEIRVEACKTYNRTYKK